MFRICFFVDVSSFVRMRGHCMAIIIFDLSLFRVMSSLGYEFEGFSHGIGFIAKIRALLNKFL